MLTIPDLKEWLERRIAALEDDIEREQDHCSDAISFIKSCQISGLEEVLQYLKDYS